MPGAAGHPDASAPGAAPIPVTGDPATPYAGARGMVQAPGPGVGVELPCKGRGHGAHGSRNPRGQDAVHGRLLEGRVPNGGTASS